MFSSVEAFKKEFTKRIVESYGREVEQSHITEKFMVLEGMVRDQASVNWATSKAVMQKEEKKQVHYFSMEFLIGRLLSNNMMNLGIYETAKEGLKEFEIEISELEELEVDPGLGNGGLGRLAACFLDSLSSLEYPGFGHTIRYEYGLFKQKIENGYQIELPDQWMKMGFMWEVRKPKHRVPVRFYGKVVYNELTRKYEHVDYEEISAVPYDVPIVGNDTPTTNTLRLWNAEASDTTTGIQDFRKYIQDVREICQTLYPDDSTYAGKTLRLKQEYFFTSAGIQSIIKAHLRQYPSMDNFHEKNVIQLNDTHPVLAIPEFMRILLDDFKYEWEQAWDIAIQTFAYTNHTILKEALETWPITLMQSIVPRVYQIIEEIHRRFIGYVKVATDHDEELLNRVYILKDGMVHMAHLAIVGSFSVNGVAALHTKILVERELKDFAKLYPNKFNNKTNGVTHRRWLAYCNPELSNFITKYTSDAWIHHPERLEDLLKVVDDKKAQKEFLAIKTYRKEILRDYIKEAQGIDVDVNSIFDIQVKRLHAYKRQLMNALHIMHLYLEMKENPKYRIYPRTFIFGAKAASSYYFAKNVIKLIHSIADTVNNDPEISPYLKVVFLDNYGVTIAEKTIPAADVSEQISTASKEASGTSNMKFMMNGAITLGTMDGANVEIVEQVGLENAVIFGLTDEEVKHLQESNTYEAWEMYNNDHKLKRVIDSLIDGTFDKNKEEFRMIYEELLNRNDEYFILKDFVPYLKAQQHIEDLYHDKSKWAKICLINIAKSGIFSTDRTIQDYVDDIWKLEALTF